MLGNDNKQLLGSGVDSMKRFLSGAQIKESHCLFNQKKSKQFAVRE